MEFMQTVGTILALILIVVLFVLFLKGIRNFRENIEARREARIEEKKRRYLERKNRK